LVFLSVILVGGVFIAPAWAALFTRLIGGRLLNFQSASYNFDVVTLSDKKAVF
jgi:hypothetical protein